jgi:hypothetical protein
MSVTRSTVEETMRKPEAGDWLPLGDIDPYGMVVIRNTRTGSRFTLCIVDYQHSAGWQTSRGKEVKGINQ